MFQYDIPLFNLFTLNSRHFNLSAVLLEYEMNVYLKIDTFYSVIIT